MFNGHEGDMTGPSCVVAQPVPFSEAINDPGQFRCVRTGRKARGGHVRAVERWL